MRLYCMGLWVNMIPQNPIVNHHIQNHMAIFVHPLFSDTLMFLIVYRSDIHQYITLYPVRYLEELLVVSYPSFVVGEHHSCEKPHMALSCCCLQFPIKKSHYIPILPPSYPNESPAYPHCMSSISRVYPKYVPSISHDISIIFPSMLVKPQCHKPPISSLFIQPIYG